MEHCLFGLVISGPREVLLQYWSHGGLRAPVVSFLRSVHIGCNFIATKDTF